MFGGIALAQVPGFTEPTVCFSSLPQKQFISNHSMNYRTRSITAGFSLLWLIAATAHSTAALPIKLNTTLPPGGKATTFKISPDGARVIYRADQQSTGVFELYSVSAAGGTPTKLNGPMVTGGDVVADFKISPDGEHVIYRADQALDESLDLYSVPISGGTPVRLNVPLAGDGSDVSSDFAVTPDNSRVIYKAPTKVSGIAHLYSVPIGGGASTRLNDDTVITDGIATGPIVTPDSQRVIYSARRNNSIFDLYSVPIEGGASVRLNGELVSGGRVFDYKVTPDGSRIIYTAEQDTDGVLELYSVPTLGGTAVKLNAILPAGGNVSSDFQIAPDGSRVVYLADQGIDGVDELYSVPTNGGQWTKLNGPLVSGGSVWNASRQKHFQITPDSAHVVYLADQDTDEKVEIYSVSIIGGIPTKLNGILPPGGDVDSSFDITPDGGQVIYRADQHTDGIAELYSVALSGGPNGRLNQQLPSGGKIVSYHIAPNSKRIIYTAEQDVAGVSEIYSVAVGGGFPIKITPALVTGGNVSASALTSNGSRLVYLADQAVDGVVELFSTDLVSGTYLEFGNRYELTTPADGDEDDDGISNLFEYLAGRHPLVSDASPQLLIFTQNEIGSLSFTLARMDGVDVRLEIETSTDLNPTGTPAWTVLATLENGVWSGHPVNLTRLGNGLVRHTLQSDDAVPSRFYRLRATLTY